MVNSSILDCSQQDAQLTITAGWSDERVLSHKNKQKLPHLSVVVSMLSQTST